MNKATFERALKAVATSKPLKTIKVVDKVTGDEYHIKNVVFDSSRDTIFIEV